MNQKIYYKNAYYISKINYYLVKLNNKMIKDSLYDELYSKIFDINYLYKLYQYI